MFGEAERPTLGSSMQSHPKEIRKVDIVGNSPQEAMCDKASNIFHKVDLSKLLQSITGMRNLATNRRFFSEVKQTTIARKKHADLLWKWEAQEERRREAQNRQKRRDRRDAIEARLREAGWGEEIDKLSSESRCVLWNMKIVVEPRELTESDWLNVRKILVRFLSTARATRLARKSEEKARLFYSAVWTYRDMRWNSGSGYQVVGSMVDYARISKVQEIIEDPDSSDTLRDRLLSVLPGLNQLWAEPHLARLVAMFRQAVGDATAVDNFKAPLRLAISAFECTQCGEGNLHFPDVCGHPCVNEVDELPKAADPYEERIFTYIAKRKCPDHERPRLRNTGVLQLARSLPVARDVVSVCGLDPYAVTPADVEACGVRLKCGICSKKKLEWEVFDWHSAISHDLRCHDALPRRAQSHWTRLTDAEASASRDLEARLSQNSPDRKKRYRCTRCGTSEPEMIGKHLIDEQERLFGHTTDHEESVTDRGVWMFPDFRSPSALIREKIAAGLAISYSVPRKSTRNSARPNVR
ncbi:uncharacterized protein BXZ73DRAFT_97827 [Epithele typhae]|uniref:uncharacterized protein n=1 Tax=Epithele typhae TaxID=378194 RepID=UPI0020078DDF|nr:uncharacterized protein BXZ73DRAFT_97827 [Epithele typhae]KAH9942415.1 hypothetical protein BXZ73DRAFT_97827 [Epithele typhae]